MKNIEVAISCLLEKNTNIIKFLLTRPPTTTSFSFIFGRFKQTTQFYMKYPSSIRHRDENPQPLDHESSLDQGSSRPPIGFNQTNLKCSHECTVILQKHLCLYFYINIHSLIYMYILYYIHIYFNINILTLIYM